MVVWVFFSFTNYCLLLIVISNERCEKVLVTSDGGGVSRDRATFKCRAETIFDRCKLPIVNNQLKEMIMDWMCWCFLKRGISVEERWTRDELMSVYLKHIVPKPQRAHHNRSKTSFTQMLTGPESSLSKVCM